MDLLQSAAPKLGGNLVGKIDVENEATFYNNSIEMEIECKVGWKI